MMRTMRPILAITTSVQLLLLEATGASVQDIVEKYGLIGTWAADCTKPSSRQNPHAVYRMADDGRLEREIKIEGGKIWDLSVALSMTESSPGETISIWLTREGEVTNRTRIQDGKAQVQDSTRESGEKLFVNGRRTRDNAEAPTFKKCP